MYQKSVDVVEWFVSVIVFELKKKKKNLNWLGTIVKRKNSL